MIQQRFLMISNERSSPYDLRRPHQPRPYQPKPPVGEDTFASKELDVERKTFTFGLKENLRGRFLRITENVGSKHNVLIIPAPGLEEFARVLGEMIKASGELPPK